MKQRLFSALLTGTAALVVLSSVALADGMPPGYTAAPAQTPLDQALDQLQGPAPEAAPPVEQAAPAAPVEPALPPPAPETRVVEVQENTSFFGLSIGMYDAFTHGQQAAALNLEWQPGVKIAGFLQPIFGGFATHEGSMMGYGGVGVPFNITDNIFLMPSVAVGAYKEGAGVDLDRTFAVRYGTELAYQFEDKSRLGINAHVISNARSFDKDDRTEIISLVYTMPTTLLSGRSEPVAQPLAYAPTNTVAHQAALVQPAAGDSTGGLRIPEGLNR